MNPEDKHLVSKCETCKHEPFNTDKAECYECYRKADSVSYEPKSCNNCDSQIPTSENNVFDCPIGFCKDLSEWQPRGFKKQQAKELKELKEGMDNSKYCAECIEQSKAIGRHQALAEVKEEIDNIKLCYPTGRMIGAESELTSLSIYEYKQAVMRRLEEIDRLSSIE